MKNRLVKSVLVAAQVTLLVACQGNSNTLEVDSPIAEAAAEEETAPSLPFIPLRISRAFFEQDLTGTIQVASADNSGEVAESGIVYAERAPEGPAPGPDAMADFRDRPGCTEFKDQAPVSLCFTVTPDISSVDLTASKLSAEGVEEYLNARSGNPACEGKKAGVRFLNAQKEGNEAVRVRFEAAAINDSGCQRPATQIELALHAN